MTFDDPYTSTGKVQYAKLFFLSPLFGGEWGGALEKICHRYQLIFFSHSQSIKY